jgi:hypothetical protein
MPIPEQENLLAAFGKAETEATFVGEEIVIPIELWDKLEVAINTWAIVGPRNGFTPPPYCCGCCAKLNCTFQK